MLETKASSNSSEIFSTEHKRNGFHAKYLSICKSKNLQPLPELKIKQRNIHILDFHADRVKVNDWVAITNALRTDKTLKFLAVRLRKNIDQVIEEADTLKKAKAIASQHAIYTKFVFGELVEALANMMTKNNSLVTLIVEGLPLTGPFMETFVKGLSNNKSIKTLSLTRSHIGDEACDSLCSTVKHLMNIETLNLSNTNLGIKGAETVANMIKSQKIQRFSEAWTQSLRYNNVDADSFPGLRKILLNHNRLIGDDGLELLTEVFVEDVWIKDVEMQDCGLTDEGAQIIIKCLDLNKTILNFNISGNQVSDHLRRHIMSNLGNSDQESSESNGEPAAVKVTKANLMEQVKFLQGRVETELYRRKKCEQLQDKLHKQLIDYQREIVIQGAFRIPDGFTLVANETLEKLLNEKSEEDPSRVVSRPRKRRVLAVKKVRSAFIPRVPCEVDPKSKSDMIIKSPTKPYIERNIGDHPREVGTVDSKPNSRTSGAELLMMFQKKKKQMEDVNHESSPIQPESPQMKLPKNFDPRSVFMNSPKRVPNNSDNDSDGQSSVTMK